MALWKVGGGSLNKELEFDHGIVKNKERKLK